MMNNDEIRIGVSACLLGQKVRYDGGHKHQRLLTDELGMFLTLVPVCPEAEVGMGIPRETVHLDGDHEAPRMVGTRSNEDWTARMNDWSRRRVRELAADDLCGFIFKKGSPSCGVWRVKLFDENGRPRPRGRGLFAMEYLRRFSLVPVEEEGRLNDARLRENFVERIFAFHRLKTLFATRWNRSEAAAFHAREKCLLMAHSPKHFKEIDRLVADIEEYTPAAFRDTYMPLFMEALAVKATVRRHTITLRHVAGHLRGAVGEAERERIRAVIADYEEGLVPLIVPITLLQHFIDIHQIPYVSDQTYLKPHPKELMLRNRV